MIRVEWGKAAKTATRFCPKNPAHGTAPLLETLPVFYLDISQPSPKWPSEHKRYSCLTLLRSLSVWQEKSANQKSGKKFVRRIPYQALRRKKMGHRMRVYLFTAKSKTVGRRKLQPLKVEACGFLKFANRIFAKNSATAYENQTCGSWHRLCCVGLQSKIAEPQTA